MKIIQEKSQFNFNCKEKSLLFYQDASFNNFNFTKMISSTQLTFWIYNVCTICLLLPQHGFSFSIIRSLSQASVALPVANRNGYAVYNYEADPHCIFVFGGVAGLLYIRVHAYQHTFTYHT